MSPYKPYKAEWLPQIPVPAPAYSQWFTCPTCNHVTMKPEMNVSAEMFEDALGEHLATHIELDAIEFLARND